MRLALVLAVLLGLGIPALSGEAECIAKTVYLEARGESRAGQLAVAHVIVNRKQHEDFPDSACAVVRQKGQFARGSVRTTESPSYQKALRVAREALRGTSGDPTGGAVYFYAHKKVRPGWARKFHTTAVIGNHTFKR